MLKITILGQNICDVILKLLQTDEFTRNFSDLNFFENWKLYWRLREIRKIEMTSMWIQNIYGSIEYSNMIINLHNCQLIYYASRNLRRPFSHSRILCNVLIRNHKPKLIKYGRNNNNKNIRKTKFNCKKKKSISVCEKFIKNILKW